jgi:hypothetical protein
MNNFKKLNEITPFVENATLADIPEALKNFNTIFGNRSNRGNGGNNQNNQNNQLLNNLINNNVFKGNSSAEIAAVEYYITNLNKSSKVTYNDLLQKFKDTSIGSIRNNVNKIKAFMGN